MKAFFKGQATQFESIESQYSAMRATFPGLQVQLAGKSVSISVPVEPLAPLEQPFDSCRDAVLASLDIAQRLAREIATRGFLT